MSKLGNALTAVLVVGAAASVIAVIAINESNKKALNTEDEQIAVMSEEDEKHFGASNDKKPSNNSPYIPEEIQEQIEDDAITPEYKLYEQLPEEEKKKQEVIPRKEVVPEEEIYEIQREQDEQINKDKEEIEENLKKEESDKIFDENDELIIPEKFDLRDHIAMHVRSQEGEGLCWAYTSTKSAETFAQLHGLGDHNYSKRKISVVESTSMFGYRDLKYESSKNVEGGNFTTFTDYLTMYGLTEADPNGLDKQDYNYTREIYMTDELIERLFDEHDGQMVVSTVEFPTIEKGSSTKQTPEEAKQIRDAIKRHIMLNGSLFTGIYTPDHDEKSFYQSGWDTPPTHAVSIIGWDDNYSVQNWIDEHGTTEGAPEHDGAYLIENSWGEDAHDNGYFYAYYDNFYIESQVSGVTSMSLEDAIDIDSPEYAAVTSLIEEELSQFIIESDGHRYVTPVTIEREKYNLSPELAKFFGEEPSIVDAYTFEVENVSELPDIPEGKRAITIRNSNLTSLDVSKIPEDTYALVCDNCAFAGNLDFSAAPKSLSSLSIVNSTNVPDITLSPYMRYFNFSNDGLSNLSILKTDNSNNNESYRFILKDNHITSLSDISNLPIESLDLENNNITDASIINSLSSIPEYSLINLSHNKISDISKLNVIDNDITLNLAFNEISGDLSTVRGHVYLNDNKISSIESLDGLQLDSLDLSNNQISDIDKLQNIQVKYAFSLNNIQACDTDFELKTAPSWLYITDSCLSSIKTDTRATSVFLNNVTVASIENLKTEVLNYTNKTVSDDMLMQLAQTGATFINVKAEVEDKEFDINQYMLDIEQANSDATIIGVSLGYTPTEQQIESFLSYCTASSTINCEYQNQNNTAKKGETSLATAKSKKKVNARRTSIGEVPKLQKRTLSIYAPVIKADSDGTATLTTLQQRQAYAKNYTSHKKGCHYSKDIRQVKITDFSEETCTEARYTRQNDEMNYPVNVINFSYSIESLQAE